MRHLWILILAGCSSTDVAADSGMDSGVEDDTGIDAAPDKTPIDTGIADVKLTCPNPKPDISGFTPPNMMVLPHPRMDACNPAQIGAFWTACWAMGSTPQTCSTFRSANQTCAQCIESTDTDSTWGVLVYGTGKWIASGMTRANFDGCLYLEGANQCALDDFILDQCEKFACEQQCPVTDNPSYLAYNNCSQTAQSGVCKGYYSKLPNDCARDAGPAVMACRGMNFQDYFMKIAPIFCQSGG